MSHLCQVEGLGHLEQLQLGDPLGVGREDEHRVVPVLTAERLHPRRGVCRQVRGAHVAAFRLDEGRQSVGDGAVIEAVLAVPGDAFQGGRERRIAQKTPYGGRLAAGQVQRLGVVVQRARLGRNVAGEPRGDRETAARVTDSRCEQLAVPHCAESIQRVHPGRHRPRHRYREGTAARHGVESAFGEQGRGGERAGATAAVQRVDPTGLRLVVQREGIASDTVHVGPDHGQHSGHGDRGVHGVAAAPKHVIAGRGGQRMIRRHRSGNSANVGAVGGGKGHFRGPSVGAGLSRSLGGLARRQRQEDSGAKEHGWCHAGY